ncbi:uncharacterized protein [Sinocyclocheilus grahami]|uniref:uncharacterized protein n=1 Tax=Sinocyclocheilus grahami TaxID=75366 RepID=UPI0007AD56AF|nr:PREDICTED: uncharacterized protein LOC107559869 [Sinocyclocheilus grahami]
MKGPLLAQTMLSRQATKKQQAQQRCFRESRGKQKRVYTSYLEGDEMEGGQRVRLVSRPMQQNIFWDESEGRILDVREMLQPSPQLTDPNVGDTSDKPLMENGIPSDVENQKSRGLGKECCHKNCLNSRRSRTDLDSGKYIHRKNRKLTRGLCYRQTLKSTSLRFVAQQRSSVFLLMGDLSQRTVAEEEEAKGMEKELRDPVV